MGWSGRAQRARTTVEQDGEASKLKELTMHAHQQSSDGDAPALADLLGGHVQVYFSSLGGAIDHVRAGRLRALAVTAAARSDALPDVPTVAETMSGYEASGFWGIGAPMNTPLEVVARINGEVNAILADPSLRTRLSELGAIPFALSPIEFTRFIAAETEKWGRIVRSARIKAS
jgi:tripartite-type tricarboxylate transporter receptor subunit TctC